jgi:cytochrome c551
MRASASLWFLVLLAIALFASACGGGPDDPQKQLELACERQIEQVGDEQTGGTPSTKSSDERDAAQTLHECAGQAPAENASAAKEDGDTTEGDDAGDADDGTTTAVKLDPAARDLFSKTCGGCHTLADAKTSGSVGPNLDELELTSDEVAEQIENGGGAMPPGLLEGDDATAVADYVAAASESSQKK